MLAKGKKIASALLEASEADIQYRNGNFEVIGTDRRISLFETARRAKEARRRKPRHQGQSRHTDRRFPTACHIAEVEIDPDSGKLELAIYTAVDDCGTVLDPVIVEGQVHGSTRAGVRPGALETCRL